jgi:hypothetical protein
MNYQTIMKLHEFLMNINLKVEEHIYNNFFNLKIFLYLFRGSLLRLSKLPIVNGSPLLKKNVQTKTTLNLALHVNHWQKLSVYDKSLNST